LKLLQNPSQTNGYTPNNVRCETNRTLREKEGVSKKIIILKQKGKTKISETYAEA